jgi:hypothetical protein
LKFLLQAGSSNDDNHTKIYLIRAIMRPRPTAACSGQFAVRQKAVVKRVKARSNTRVCLISIIRNAGLYFGTAEEEFQRATFFSLRWPIRQSGAWHSAARVDSIYNSSIPIYLRTSEPRDGNHHVVKSLVPATHILVMCSCQWLSLRTCGPPLEACDGLSLGAG